MALDRDLAVAVVRAVLPSGGPRARGWETNAATGVRGLRLLAESGRFAAFRLSEAGDRSFPVLEENARRGPGAEAVHEDARRLPDGARRSFDYVDVDPYGSPLPFLGPALAAVREGGVLAATATDLIVLAGAHPKETRRIYGSEPVRGRLGPEGGLRILLATIAASARRDGLVARPLLSYVEGHHLRAYVRLAPAGSAPDPVGRLDPATFDGPELGTERPVGPLWVGPLADPDLVARLEVPATSARPTEVARLVALWREETAIVRPFFFEPNALASSLGLPRPPGLERLIEALRGSGFRASRTHVRPEGLKTDAPRSEVERLARSLAA